MSRIFIRQLREGAITVARGAGSLLGAANLALAADPAISTDVANPTWPQQMFDCSGYDSIWVGASIAGGTAPTMTVQLLWRDSEAADGSRWRTFTPGARDGTTLGALVVETSGALGDNSAFVEMRTYGHRFVFPRITVVGGTVSGSTGWLILAKPGWVRPSSALKR